MSKQFKITIKKYFEIKGKNYKKTTIDHSILFDPLVDELPNSNKWLLIALIMIAGEHGNATITLSERRVNELLKTKEGAENALLSLQQYQVLSYEKTASNKRNKERRKEVIQEKKEEVNEEKENVPEGKINLGKSEPYPSEQKTEIARSPDPKETPPPERKHVDIFSSRIKFRDWEAFLREKKIYTTTLGRSLDKLSDRFESVELMKEFIESVLSSPKTEKMDKISLRRYVQGALINEAGIR